MLKLPGKHHALHILGLLAKDGEMRFGELVKATRHEDTEISRGLAWLKECHFVRTRARKVQGRVVNAYSISLRGQAAWDAYNDYAMAVVSREETLGAAEARAMTRVLTV